MAVINRHTAAPLCRQSVDWLAGVGVRVHCFVGGDVGLLLLMTNATHSVTLLLMMLNPNLFATLFVFFGGGESNPTSAGAASFSH